MTLARDRANAAQRLGSDPTLSAFVGASAGSGKTKLLTDRLLRLMLAGVRPERIQCLTFTKAAAAEMAVRLNQRLGRWVTLPDAALAAELKALSVVPSAETMRRARKLFATVLDLPGGMRIGTIHAFCQSLLRRFPLEAALSPHFAVADERETADVLTEAREDMLAAANDPAARAALALLAAHTLPGDFHSLIGAMLSEREKLAPALALGAELAAAQRRVLGAALTSRDEAIAAAADCPELHDLRPVLAILAREGSAKVSAKAAELLAWLDREPAVRAGAWHVWESAFLTEKGVPRAPRVNIELARRAPAVLQAMCAEAERVHAVAESCRALDLAALSNALVTLAAPVLRLYARRKDEAGLLDYDDLITRSAALLVDPGAAWVLYKLDGGLDHLLLDEVQDTAPAQWRIVAALTGEFFAGAGAAATKRTVFAVGDRKQSIFSFQGADVSTFDAARAALGRRVRAAGERWAEPSLDVSFRSSPPVLALVDAVFAQPPAAAGVAAPGVPLRHESDRAGHAGRVELWPLAPAPPAEPDPPPPVPDRNRILRSARQVLAEALADWIARETSGDVALESRFRPLRPGDVMVLLRRRDAFARALVRELKSRAVPVAGLDRLLLTDQPAVQDLLALCDVLLLPQDDLQLACVLTSPLGGLSDDSLMELALGRPGTLWEALRARAPERPEWARAAGMIAALLGRVDYAGPYALLAEALGPMGGRARLFARLGPEAGEAIDELLNAALAYARMHPPSLQGFLHWLRRSAAEVKREQEGTGDAVRVLTVHGAKGLQAPLVILPDTTALPPTSPHTVLWAQDPQTGVEVPLWAPRADLHCAQFRALRDAVKQRALEEHNRLLYVALTRAEDRLVVCGWEPGRSAPAETCWYRLVEAGMRALGAERTKFAAWDGEVMSFGAPQTAPVPEPEAAPAQALVPLPGWAGAAPDWRPAPPPPEPPRPVPLAPSRPEGIAFGPVPAAESPLSGTRRGAIARGRLIHALLQHLPSIEPGRRAAAARAWIARQGGAIGPEEAARAASQVTELLDRPDLAPLFGPGSRAEVPISGLVGDQVVGGLVDRLAVLPGRVLIADYKTNRRPPARPEATPVLYLRQIAAYRAVLRQVFPGRVVDCALIWTEAGRADWLDASLLDRHAP
ncbi:MAG TPA: double-strand break repair helicase AddA [Acetobacteraceae bacterium]|nr:double-strand break repair helicase AddA [Acetobacteraceae bacterium]